MRLLDRLEVLAVLLLAVGCGVAATLTVVMLALYSGILPS